MISIIGYFGSLFFTLGVPAITLSLLIYAAINIRVAGLGGREFFCKRFELLMDNGAFAILAGICVILSSAITAIWCLETLSGKIDLTFFEFHSKIAEHTSPAMVVVLTILALIFICDKILCAYVLRKLKNQ